MLQCHKLRTSLRWLTDRRVRDSIQLKSMYSAVVQRHDSNDIGADIQIRTQTHIVYTLSYCRSPWVKLRKFANRVGKSISLKTETREPLEKDVSSIQQYRYLKTKVSLERLEIMQLCREMTYHVPVLIRSGNCALITYTYFPAPFTIASP